MLPFMTPMMMGPAAGGASALRPEDVFAVRLYSGDGTSKKIALPFQPDLVWEKRRNSSSRHILTDSSRGPNVYLDTSSNEPEISRSGIPGTFYGDGYAAFPFNSGDTALGLAFKRAAKFMDIVPYTGNGVSGRVIPHGLGVKPGMIVVFNANPGGAHRAVYHRAVPGKALYLSATDAAFADDGGFFGGGIGTSGVEPTAAGFTVGNRGNVNASGSAYIALVFAHDPDTTGGIVQCFSYSTNSSGAGSVNLGWRPQFLLFRAATDSTNWVMMDASRGLGSGSDKALAPNSISAEFSGGDLISVTNTGFSDSGLLVLSGTVIGLAIRAPKT